jgi:hypothetical protein
MRHKALITLGAATVLVAGAIAAIQLGSTETGITYREDGDPVWGARVILGTTTGVSCIQNAAVTVKTTSPGLLFKNGPYNVRWLTKSEVVTLGDGPSPPFIKGKLQPNEWILQHQFTEPQKYRLYFASSGCLRADGLGYKWNASIVTVTVVP